MEGVNVQFAKFRWDLGTSVTGTSAPVTWNVVKNAP
jgi:hypothetical protein